MALRIQGWCGPGVCGKHGVLGPGLSAKQRVGEAVENTGTLFLLLRRKNSSRFCIFFLQEFLV